MCNSCNLQANYFHSVDCIYNHLVATNPVLWLRDSSRVGPGYISRNLLSPTGKVLAIWKGKGNGWKLREYKHQALDEVPVPGRGDFVDLSDESTRFMTLLGIDE